MHRFVSLSDASPGEDADSDFESPLLEQPSGYVGRVALLVHLTDTIAGDSGLSLRLSLDLDDAASEANAQRVLLANGDMAAELVGASTITERRLFWVGGEDRVQLFSGARAYWQGAGITGAGKIAGLELLLFERNLNLS